MVQIATPFGSNRGKFNYLGNSSLVNCYAEIDGEQGRARYVIVQSDGLTQFATGVDTRIRGSIYLPDLQLLYTVHSSTIWKTDSGGTQTNVGTIPGIDTVEMVRNNNVTVAGDGTSTSTPQIGVRCDAGFYVVQDDVVTQLIDPDLPDVETVDQQGGFTVFGIEDGRFFISGLNEMTTVNALDFDTANTSADKLIKVRSDGSDIYLHGELTTEVWRNTGNADFPYEPVGEAIRTGIGAKFTSLRFDNSLVWVGDDFIVYRLDGFTPRRISNHEVERLILNDPDAASIEAMEWSRGGHVYYTLTGTDWTRSYDAVTQQWHERKSYKQVNWRARFAVFAFGETIVGDRLSGDLFRLNSNVFDENGEHMVMEITYPDMQAFPNGGIVDTFHIDFLTGQGKTVATAQGHDPLMMLDWSDDGGNNYKNVRELPLGKQGAFSRRVTTRRLGRFGRNGRVWRMRVSDPIPRALALADAELRLRRL